MNRRQALSIAALVFAAPVVRAADTPPYVTYRRDAYEQALASGKPFLLDFSATW